MGYTSKFKGSEIDALLEQVQKGGGGGGTVKVDMEMSDTSENAVANRVIKEYVDGFIPLCREFSDDFNNSYSI